MSSEKLATEVGWGEDVFKEIPRHRREFYQAVKPYQWPIKHAALDLDIGIAPLIDDYFNWCKTPIKWMEYGTLKTPAVVSKVLYGDYVKDGKDAMVAETEDQWFEKLSLLIEDADLRKKMGKEAYHTVDKDFNLNKKWTMFEDVYTDIVYGTHLADQYLMKE